MTPEIYIPGKDAALEDTLEKVRALLTKYKFRVERVSDAIGAVIEEGTSLRIGKPKAMLTLATANLEEAETCTENLFRVFGAFRG